MSTQNNANTNAYIVDYEFEKEEIRLKIKIKLGKVLEYKKGRYVVALRSSVSKKELMLEVKSIDLSGGEFCVLVGVKPDKYTEIFSKEIVNVYLIDRDYGIDNKVNAKYMKCSIDLYYNSKNKKFIQLYKDGEGCLSLREKSGGREVYLKNVEIDDTGKISVEGILNCAKLDANGKSTALKKVRIINKSGDIRAEVEVDTFPIDELVEKNNYTGIDYDHCGFKFDINLIESGVNKGTLNGAICLVLGEDEVEVKLRQPKKKISINQVVYKNSRPMWLLNFTGRKFIKFTLEDVRRDIEFRELYINKGKIELVIKKELNDIDLSDKKRIEMVLKDERKEREYRIKCRVEESEDINIIAFFDEFASKQNIELDTYDVYLRIKGEDRKIVSRCDQIMNKNEIVKFPKLHLIDRNKNAISLKTFYTDKNGISIKVEKMMETKNIESVFVDSNGINIKGLMCIRKPLETDKNEFAGILKMELYYGIKVTLPYVAKIESTDNVAEEYEFKICIPREEVEASKFNVNYIVKNMSNKVVICYVDSTPERRNLVLNIKAENVKITLEDIVKKLPVAKTVLNGISQPMYYLFNKILPINNKLVVFQSYCGSSYSCNPRAIYEELQNSGEKYKCVWVLEEAYKEIPGMPKVVKPKSIPYYYYMSRAKYFVSNTSMPEFYKKRNGAMNIETGCGTPLKKMGLDIKEGYTAYKNCGDNEFYSISESGDVLIVPNQYTGEVLTKAYSYENEILELGYPRNDIFYKNPKKREQEVRKKLNIPNKKKVILYAPTFREEKKDISTYKMPFSVESFNNIFGNDYILLIRLHHADANKLSNLNEYKNVKNVSLYDDIAELYLVADILVTDYSSAMFDYANSKKPMLFYAYDLKEYEENARGLYLNFKEIAPGPIVESEKELFDAIKDIDRISVKYKNKYSDFKKRYCSKEDGESSKRVVEKLFKEYMIG